jgi:rhamnopyranosyl-N-acetylglucosaminyl-diphospho-decaprenol beta-1,3/1,4-galactofuranosyltransferase
MVWAVVVTYNRRELLEQCLDALLAQTRPPDRILVVDNASTDGTVVVARARTDRRSRARRRA